MSASLRASVLASALLAAATTPAAWADDPLAPPQFSIMQSAPSTGTHIPRKIVQGSAIPLNRSYSQLTDEERQLIRSQYEAMWPLDEPPFPLAGLKPIHEAIAEAQRRLLVEGKLSMMAEVDAHGAVTSVGVYQSPDPRLTEAAASVLMLTKFKPAVCHGEPCNMSFPLRVTFQVDR
jgi:hypothetical protein